jgi:hypothetical protein
MCYAQDLARVIRPAQEAEHRGLESFGRIGLFFKSVLLLMNAFGAISETPARTTHHCTHRKMGLPH